MIIVGINGAIESGKDTLFSFLPEPKVRLAFGDALKEEVAALLSTESLEEVLSFLIVKHASADFIRNILAETWGIKLTAKELPTLDYAIEHLSGAAISTLCAPFKAVRYKWVNLKERMIAAMHDRLLKETFRTLMQWWGTEYRRVQTRDDYWVNIIREQVNALQAKGFDGILCLCDTRFPNEAQFVKHELGGLVGKVIRPGTGGSKHLSDTALASWNFDFTIYNDGTLKQFERKVLSMAARWQS